MVSGEETVDQQGSDGCQFGQDHGSDGPEEGERVLRVIRGDEVVEVREEDDDSGESVEEQHLD